MPRDRRLYTDDLAAEMTPGDPFQPSSGSEWRLFQRRWCQDCANHGEVGSLWPDLGCTLDIDVDASMFEPGEEGYPPEWVIDANGQPSCTAHTERKEAP